MPLTPISHETQNPASGVYAGRMVDASRIMLYTWDARPYPAFPALRTIWSDGDNWQLGHWLTGRVADAPLAEAVITIMADYGFAEFDAGQLAGSMAGYVIDRVMSARDALQPLEDGVLLRQFRGAGPSALRPSRARRQPRQPDAGRSGGDLARGAALRADPRPGKRPAPRRQGDIHRW